VKKDRGMQIEEISVDKLIPYENNPRNNDTAAEFVANSIKEFGFKVPIIIDRNNVIVAGHTRLKAAKILGLETVPCIRASDLTEEQVKAFRLADNKTAEMAEWDMAALEAELAELKAIGVDMSSFGFDSMETVESLDGITEDEVPEPPEEPKAKTGDIYELGDHRLICGDCLDPEVIERLTAGAKIDLMLTDPPYNVAVGSIANHANLTGFTIQNDDMPDEEFTEWLPKALQPSWKQLKAGGPFYVWHAAMKTAPAQQGLQKLPEIHLSSVLIWVKNAPAVAFSDYQWQHEPCFYGWKEGATHYFTNSRAESTVIEDSTTKLSTLKKSELIKLVERLRGDMQEGTVRRAEKISVAQFHPTVKPQELLAPLIRNSSRPGESVIDPFGGSGSTLIACEQLGRKAYLCEIEPKYIDVTIQRWETLTGKKARKVGGSDV